MKKKLLLTRMTVFLFSLLLWCSSGSAQTNCPAPVALPAANITASSATLDWTLNGSNPIGFTSRYRIISVPNSPWVTLIPPAKPLVLNGLQALTAYEWQIASICSNTPGTTITSAYSNSIIFTTSGNSNACPVPSGLFTDSITTGTAVVHWQAVAGTSSYNVRYRIANSITWTTVNSTAPAKILTGLLANSNYEWQVQSVCPGLNGAVTLSAFSASQFFVTLNNTSNCPTPQNLTVTNITSSSANLSWGSTGASSYLIRYRAIGVATWSYASASGNSKVLNGLQAGTAYKWQVRSKCMSPAGNLTNSAWSVQQTFTTIPQTTGCNAPTGLFVDSISANSATAHWNAAPGAISYQLSYQAVNTSNWIYLSSNTTSKTMNNLSPNIPYICRVRSLCSNSAGTVQYSAWSPLFTFIAAPLARLFPNPAAATLFAKYNVSEGGISKIRIMDFNGISVLEKEEMLQSGENNVTMDVSTLRNGIYYYEINTADGVQRGKIMVKHE